MKYILESIHDVVNMNAGYKDIAGKGAYSKLQQMKQTGQKVAGGLGASTVINKVKNTMASKANITGAKGPGSDAAKFLAKTGLQSRSA